MASTSSLSLSHGAQLQFPPWPRPPKRNSSIHKNLHSLSRTIPIFLSNPLLASSFPVGLDSSSNHFQLLPLQDAVHDNFVEHLENSANLVMPAGQNHQILSPDSRIFIRDPPWISALFLKGLYKLTDRKLILEHGEMEKKKYNMLRRRQVKEETEAWERMVDEYSELQREMCERKLAPNLPYVKNLFLGWFEPLKEAIARDQHLQKNKKKWLRAAYAPQIDLLPPEKMAVIVMHKIMGLVMACHEDGFVQVVQAAVHIGSAIEQEVSTGLVLDV